MGQMPHAQENALISHECRREHGLHPDRVARICMAILRLHRDGGAVPAVDFPSWAMGIVGELVPHDLAIWEIGAGETLAGRWQTGMVGDFFVRSERGGKISEAGLDAVHFDGKGQESHLPGPRLGKQVLDPETGLVDVLHLCRIDPSFSVEERLAFEYLAPNLVEARRRNCLEAFGRKNPESCWCHAVCDSASIVHAIDECFLKLLRIEWPQWRGPVLPDPVLRIPDGGKFVGKHLVVEAFQESGGRFLRARERMPVDELSHREHEVARAYSSGRSYKEIGRYYGISPSTVSNHLTTIYRKLGICDKTELAMIFIRYD